MKKQSSSIIFFLIFAVASVWAQAEDPILFTVDEQAVHLSEFDYIYSKTNGKKADYSKGSLDEYLDLYIKFKLKVQKAKDMRLDTIPSLQKELAGYRQQLANSYLIDKEVTEQLTKEVYERSKIDVGLSHILILVKPGASPKDTITLFTKAKTIKGNLERGASFEKLAQEFSDDKSTKENGGKIGFVTAMLPNGFYQLESAAYKLKKGEIAGPIRTAAGYHIIRKDGERPARGQIEVAHILARDSDKVPKLYAENKIESIHQKLQSGEEDWDALAKSLSEDKKSAAKGGYIGFFGINRYEKAFEEAAFSLEKDGDYSGPIRTSAGWHLIKRLSKKPMESYQASKARIEAKVKNDGRHEIAKQAMIQRIKKQADFEENPEHLEAFSASLDKNFTTHRWRPSKTPNRAVLFQLGGESVDVHNFESYLGKSSRNRMRMGQNMTPQEVANSLYKNFVDESCLKYEEKQLEVKYPEFKSLMREYEEGILLFEATKIQVWDRASQDEEGLTVFHQGKENNYLWGERAVISIYSLAPEASDQLEKLRKICKKKKPEKVLKKFNKKAEVLKQSEKIYEKGKNEVLDALPWIVGSLSEVETNKRDKTLNFMKIEKLLAPMPKSLKEARGYVVADYQDYLEKQWIEQLKTEYRVEVNQDIFEGLVK